MLLNSPRRRRQQDGDDLFQNQIAALVVSNGIRQTDGVLGQAERRGDAGFKSLQLGGFMQRLWMESQLSGTLDKHQSDAMATRPKSWLA